MRDEIPIHYLRRYEIDTKKWDECIIESANGLIYAHAFYLDHMAKQWDALIMGNYDVVMPLPFNQKWRIPYLYQPPFSQQLGVFNRIDLDKDLIAIFIAAAKKRFSFAEIFLNSRNPFSGAVLRNNYVLRLDSNYSDLRSGYKSDLIKNLKRLKKLNLIYVCSKDYLAAVQFFFRTYGTRTPHVKVKDYQQFKGLCKHALENDMLLVRQVFSVEHEPLATALLLKDNRRIYNIMSTTSSNGRRCGANHFLFEELIKEFAGKEIILDFEGSDIPGIAKFYQKFGAINEPYFFLRYNNLSKPLKWLKK